MIHTLGVSADWKPAVSGTGTYHFVVVECWISGLIMNQVSESIELKMTADGVIDHQYYKAQAHAMRGEYLGELYTAFVARVKKLIKFDRNVTFFATYSRP